MQIQQQQGWQSKLQQGGQEGEQWGWQRGEHGGEQGAYQQGEWQQGYYRPVEQGYISGAATDLTATCTGTGVVSRACHTPACSIAGGGGGGGREGEEGGYTY